jgi:hypothetical protein
LTTSQKSSSPRLERSYIPDLWICLWRLDNLVYRKYPGIGIIDKDMALKSSNTRNHCSRWLVYLSICVCDISQAFFVILWKAYRGTSSP